MALIRQFFENMEQGSLPLTKSIRANYEIQINRQISIWLNLLTILC